MLQLGCRRACSAHALAESASNCLSEMVGLQADECSQADEIAEKLVAIPRTEVSCSHAVPKNPDAKETETTLNLSTRVSNDDLNRNGLEPIVCLRQEGSCATTFSVQRQHLQMLGRNRGAPTGSPEP